MAVLNTTSPSPVTLAPSARPTNARPSSSTSAAHRLAANYHHPVRAVLLGDADVDELGVGGRHVLADVVRSDRQLTVPSIDENRELDRARAAELDERLHR